MQRRWFWDLRLLWELVGDEICVMEERTSFRDGKGFWYVDLHEDDCGERTEFWKGILIGRRNIVH